MSRGADDEDGFLGRWSRRKRQADRDAAVEPEAGPVAETSEPVALEPEPETDEEVLARLDLPHPDTLAPGDDVARYLRAPLSQGMKQLVLRRLWRSNPVLANLDGLNDYDTDFTGGGVAPGMLKSAYEVGRGYAARAVEALSPEDELAQPEGETAGRQEDVEADVAETTQQDEPETASSADAEEVSEMPENYAEARTARRMVFRFDD